MTEMKTKNDETLDTLFKKSLSNKVFLALIMKECIEEYKNEDLNTIIHDYIENHIQVGEKEVFPKISGTNTELNIDNKRTTYDINFYAKLPKQEDNIGIIINIEAQDRLKRNYHMMNRAHFYNARNLSNQIEILVAKDDYDKLKKVVSIWIILNPPVENQNAITAYKMSEQYILGQAHINEEIYNKNEIVMVYLSKESSNSFIQLFNDLRDRKLNMNEFKTQLKEEYNYELDDKIESEVNQMCNFSQYVKEEGRLEGRLEGIDTTMIQNIINMMDSFKLSIDQVMDGMKLSIQDKEKYRSLVFEIMQNQGGQSNV